MDKENLPKVIFIGGKGGVGKSTTASGLAFSLANMGKKSLLVSTDPAHNLSDIFGIKLSNQVTAASKQLDIIEIDAQKEAKLYVEKVAKSMRGFVGANSYDRIDDYFLKVADSASTLEAALFERLSQILTIDINSYDHIIIDTAPTGHTLRLFFMPGQLRDWSKNLLSMQERGGMAESVLGHLSKGDNGRFSDPDGFIRGQLIELLDERYQRYSAFANLIKDTKRCGIILVLNASKLALNETLRAIDNLKQKGLSPYAILLNKVLPASSSDEFLHARIKQEMEYIVASDKHFSAYRYAKMPLFKVDITNIDRLKIFGETLFKVIL